MRIKDLNLKEIFDSRGEPTIEVGVSNLKGNWFFAQIPSGLSRGKKEAAVLSPEKAANVLEKIKKEIISKDFKSIAALDKKIISLDGTEKKTRLGGNLMLGISIAFACALAAEKNKEVWQILRNDFFANLKNSNRPLIFSNLINGGLHAKNNLNIQEYMVIAKPAKSYAEIIKKIIKIYALTGDYLKKIKNVKNLPIGDEEGYAVDLENNYEPIKILERMIVKLGFQKEFKIGLDTAASSFYKNGKYNFGGKKINSGGLLKIYLEYLKNSKFLVLIEDPFAETDTEGFKKFQKKNAALIVGDDLTVTNPPLIKKFSNEKAIGGVIIKPNQIGTITETCEAIKIAKKNKLKTIISHRSGETKDNFIIHLAKASNANGVKIGAPLNERIFKFDELIRIFD